MIYHIYFFFQKLIEPHPGSAIEQRQGGLIKTKVAQFLLSLAGDYNP